MPFPAFDFCFICDGVRPELGGKLTILGFYGVAPQVEVVVGNAALPVTLAVVAGFPPISDVRTAYEYSIVITKPDHVVIQQTPPTKLNISHAGRGLVILGFAIVPPIFFGTYSIRILVNGEVKLDTSFRLRLITPTEVASMGGFMLPTPPTPKPN